MHLHKLFQTTGSAIVLVGIFVAGCAGGALPRDEPTWGPLAVVPGPPVGLDALATGTLRINGECVTLEAGGSSFMPVWPADRTEWLTEQRAVRFTNDEGVVDIADGQQVGLGGGGTDGESHRFGDDWVGHVEWKNAPAEVCDTGHPWWVNAVLEPAFHGLGSTQQFGTPRGL